MFLVFELNSFLGIMKQYIEIIGTVVTFFELLVVLINLTRKILSHKKLSSLEYIKTSQNEYSVIREIFWVVNPLSLFRKSV